MKELIQINSFFTYEDKLLKLNSRAKQELVYMAPGAIPIVQDWKDRGLITFVKIGGGYSNQTVLRATFSERIMIQQKQQCGNHFNIIPL